MRSSNIIKSLAVFMTLTLSVKSLALTDAQKDEFLHKGTITVLDAAGKKKGHFEARFMMGTDKIGKHTKEHWEHAAKLMADLVKTEDFWHKKMVKRFFDGLNYASDCCRDGIGSIPSQFCSTVDKNSHITGFGANAAKLKNWLVFGGTCVADVAITAWGLGAGTIWAIAAPTATLLYRPIAAGTEALVAGTVWPAVAYAYTGIAYELVKNSAEPKEGDITVTYIPEREIQHDEMAEEDFSNFERTEL